MKEKEMDPHKQRINDLCDYLETIPGEHYNFAVSPDSHLDSETCGCAIGLGIHAGLVMADNGSTRYLAGIRWLTGLKTYDEFNDMVTGFSCQREYDEAYEMRRLQGSEAKRAAIVNLRAYADGLA